MASDPSFFLRIIHNAWKRIGFPRSQYEGELPLSLPSSVIRTRSLTICSFQNHGSNQLPLYANATEMVKLEYLPKSRFTLSNRIVSLTFQAVLAMVASRDQRHLVGAAMVIAFAASFSAVIIKPSLHRVAAIFEKISYLSFAAGFFVMARGFFSGSLTMQIIGWLAWALPVLAFLIDCLI